MLSVLLGSSKSDWRSQVSADLGEDVRLAQHEQFLVLDGDLGAAVFGVEDLIALRYVQRDALLTVVVPSAIAYGDDLSLLRLLFRRVGEDDSACGRLLLINRLDDQPVPEGLQLHP